LKLVTSEQMRELEKTAIEDFGVPSIILMENASIGFFTELKNKIDLFGKKICVCCGKGNNGGDGFAVSRHLSNDGYDVSCILSFDESKAKALLTEDAYTNYQIAKNMGIPMLTADESFEKYDIIIDSLLGTGIKGAARKPEADIIDKINDAGVFTCALDIPSGADASNGKVSGSCVKADLTITFAFAKVGHFLYPTKEYVGKLAVCPISIPKSVEDNYNSNFFTLCDSIFSFLPKRNKNSHKGDFGKVLACVGSDNMSGAAMLSVSAVFKSGVGMVTAASTEKVLANIVLNTPEAMTLPLADNGTTDAFYSALEKNDVLLLGCGMGRSEHGEKFVEEVVSVCEKPMIIDADGINNLSRNIDILYKKKAPIILTPHTVEFSRMTGLSPEHIEENRLDVALSFAKKYDVTLVLKGADTIIASPEGKVFISAIANSGLATAGSGDVLSGIIAGFLAQGAEPNIAAAAGVYAHSLSGLKAAEILGARSMTASDIISYLPDTLKTIK